MTFFFFYQYEVNGTVADSMLVNTILMLVYVTKFFWWEAGYWNTMDIAHDRGSHMLYLLLFLHCLLLACPRVTIRCVCLNIWRFIFLTKWIWQSFGGWLHWYSIMMGFVFTKFVMVLCEQILYCILNNSENFMLTIFIFILTPVDWPTIMFNIESIFYHP